MKYVSVLALTLSLGACAATKMDEFTPINGVGQANREQAYAVCRAKADYAGMQARAYNQATTPGYIAIGSPSYVAGAALGHAIGSAISQGVAYTQARDTVLAGCMAEAGYVKGEAPKPAPNATTNTVPAYQTKPQSTEPDWFARATGK